MSKEAVRSHILEAGLEAVTSRTGGMRVALDVNLEALVAQSDLPRSSVYRTFPAKQEFYDEIVGGMIDSLDTPAAMMFSPEDITNAELQSLEKLVASSDEDSRHTALNEATGATFLENAGRRQNILRPSLLSIVESIEPDEDHFELARRYAESEARLAERAAEYFARVGNRVSYEMREGKSYHELVDTSIAYLGGLALQSSAVSRNEGFERSVRSAAGLFVDGYMQPKV